MIQSSDQSHIIPYQRNAFFKAVGKQTEAIIRASFYKLNALIPRKDKLKRERVKLLAEYYSELRPEKCAKRAMLSTLSLG